MAPASPRGTTAPDSEPDMLVDINTTPLIDVMLVLLIMFIVTIPMQTHAIRMALPAPGAAAATPPPLPALRVDVAADGSITWDGERLDATDRETLEARAQAAAARAPRPEVHLHPDAGAAYGSVARVLAATQRHGLERVAIHGSEGAR
jgi:biopolymer transport protein ExbD